MIRKGKSEIIGYGSVGAIQTAVLRCPCGKTYELALASRFGWDSCTRECALRRASEEKRREAARAAAETKRDDREDELSRYRDRTTIARVYYKRGHSQGMNRLRRMLHGVQQALAASPRT